ncbi:hypothetical protein GCM10011381_10260 [Klenkia taihuensis]|nr:hypothetical protein GCM10011381_10260 [Klenkia taihuensis]
MLDSHPHLPVLGADADDRDEHAVLGHAGDQVGVDGGGMPDVQVDQQRARVDLTQSSWLPMVGVTWGRSVVVMTGSCGEARTGSIKINSLVVGPPLALPAATFGRLGPHPRLWTSTSANATPAHANLAVTRPPIPNRQSRHTSCILGVGDLS